MKITSCRIKVSEVAKGYVDKDDEGVFGYDGKLTIRPISSISITTFCFGSSPRLDNA